MKELYRLVSLFISFSILSAPTWYVRGFEGFGTAQRDVQYFQFNDEVVNTRSSRVMAAQSYWRYHPLIVYDHRHVHYMILDIEEYIQNELAYCRRGDCPRIPVNIIAFSRGAVHVYEALERINEIPSIDANIFTIDPVRFVDGPLEYESMDNITLMNYYQEYGNCNASGFVTSFIGFSNCSRGYKGVDIIGADRSYRIYDGENGYQYIYHNSMPDHAMAFIGELLSLRL